MIYLSKWDRKLVIILLFFLLLVVLLMVILGISLLELRVVMLIRLKDILMILNLLAIFFHFVLDSLFYYFSIQVHWNLMIKMLLIDFNTIILDNPIIICKSVVNILIFLDGKLLGTILFLIELLNRMI